MGKAMGTEKDPDLDGDEKEAETAWDDEIQEWEESDQFENTTLKISVYRQPIRGGEREKVWEFTDEIVSSHEIGQRFGGGRYSTYARIFKDGKIVKTIRRTFRLSESSYAPPQAPQQMAGAAMPQPMSIENILRMIQAAIPVAVALKDLFGGGGGTKLAAMEDAQKVVGRVIEESARREIAMIKTIRTEVMNNGEAKTTKSEDEEPLGTEEELKSYLLDVLKQYGPGLIEAIGLKLTTAKRIIKTDPVFAALAKNEALFARVHGLLTADPDLAETDKAMIEKVLTKISDMGIGIRVPPRPANVNGARAHA